jgi:hypothetical protein
MGWKPNVFFQVGAACCFSEWAITIVASRSMVTSPPSAPGAASPASAHARSRAAARAARMAFRARGRSPASWLTSRDTTGSDATGPASSGCPRSTAMSARQSPPRATAAARSATTLPGSCTARGARHRARPSDRPRPRSVTRIVSHSRTAPAWDTRPRPSADTMTRAPRALLFTGKCLRLVADRSLDKSYSSRSEALSSFERLRLADPRRKPGLTRNGDTGRGDRRAKLWSPGGTPRGPQLRCGADQLPVHCWLTDTRPTRRTPLSARAATWWTG